MTWLKSGGKLWYLDALTSLSNNHHYSLELMLYYEMKFGYQICSYHESVVPFEDVVRGRRKKW